MTALPVVGETNERPDVCGPCGGECCKRMPGNFHPADFGPGLEGLEKALADGVAEVDWVECYVGPDGGLDDNAEGYFVRTAIVGHRRVYNPVWGGGVCVNLTEAGCRFAFADRPRECRELVPADVLGSCRNVGGYSGKWQAADAWWPFRDTLKDIADRVAAGKSAVTC